MHSFSYWNARGPTLHSGEDAETGRLIPAGTFWYVWLMFSGGKGEKCICGCLHVFVGMNDVFGGRERNVFVAVYLLE